MDKTVTFTTHPEGAIFEWVYEYDDNQDDLELPEYRDLEQKIKLVTDNLVGRKFRTAVLSLKISWWTQTGYELLSSGQEHHYATTSNGIQDMLDYLSHFKTPSGASLPRFEFRLFTKGPRLTNTIYKGYIK